MKSSFGVALGLSLFLLSCRDQDSRPDAGADAGLAAPCVIDAVGREAGEVDEANACAVCDPARSTTAWSMRADGSACGAGRVCAAGSCSAQCFIDGTRFAADAVNPDDACEVCAPASSTTNWSARADGTACGGGEVCVGGECRARCLIEGVVISAGDTNPNDPCQQCTPATSTTTWSTRMDGVSCALGKVCEAGGCATRCFIGGVFYDASTVNPANPCERCDPLDGAHAWSLRLDGTSCGAGQVCGSGQCLPACFIDGALRSADEVNVQNACEQCTPSSSTTEWSPRNDGTSCATGRVCEAAVCSAKCFIGGVFFVDGAPNPANPCEQCAAATSTTAWTPRATVPLLGGGVDVAQQGWSVMQQGNASITYDPGFVRLATSTTTGASTSGALLLHRSVVDAGVPFTVRAEIQVESVSPHNQFDSGAAILGSFTPPFGSSTDRNQMVFLDAASVGWADNIQSAPLAVTNGLFRTYELSVDATGAARLSVDGAPLLTRTNFVSNGRIALGDQTNDPNVDGVMRIRSVSRVCP